MTDFQNAELTPEVVSGYFRYLVNRLFKILPIRENEEGSLTSYLTSLQREMLGFQSMLDYLHGDARYVSLMAKLQWMIEHPDCEFRELRSEVFGAISICNGLKVRYGPGGEARA